MLLRHQDRGNPRLAPPPATVDLVKRNASLHGQGRHVGGRQTIPKLIRRQDEVDLVRVELDLPVERRDEIIEAQGIGIAEEDGVRGRRLESKNLRSCNMKRILASVILQGSPSGLSIVQAR